MNLSFYFSAVMKFLMSEPTIADISSGLGFKTLIRCDVRLFRLYSICKI